MELKQIGEAGEFSGYAAVFGNIDDGGDVIERGAFKEFSTTKDNLVRVLYQHDPRNPIGKANVAEDAKGLRFEGRLVLEDALARKAYAFMKAGILDGMSIGYDVIQPHGAEIRDDGVRLLKELKLWEISPVTWGMNPLAGIERVKQRENITNIREFEEFLRDAGGFSRAQAKLLARAWNTLPGQRDADEKVDEEVKQIVDSILLSASKFA
jgi:HK97 family phage prohead protease